MRPLIIALTLMLAACASVPQRPPVDDPAAVWQVRQARLARVNAWDLRGRLALRTQDEGANASLRWVRSRGWHRMNLAGPFGGGRVRLTYDREGAELRDADGKIYRGASMQELLWRETGWILPIEGLNYWVLGLPDPEAPAQTTLDQWGRLKSLKQSGWDVRFLEYTRIGGYELPRRVFAKHESNGVSDPEIEARLVIENWTVSSAVAESGAPSPAATAAGPVDKSSP